MNAQLLAAIIAASVSVLTLIGTVVAQIIGFRSTRANTQQQITATHQDTAATLEEQRTRTLNERFATAASQLDDMHRRVGVSV
jgi:uncharacterized membrane-anchored protein YhcB (DUF1043 family)